MLIQFYTWFLCASMSSLRFCWWDSTKRRYLTLLAHVKRRPVVVLWLKYLLTDIWYDVHFFMSDTELKKEENKKAKFNWIFGVRERKSLGQHRKLTFKKGWCISLRDYISQWLCHALSQVYMICLHWNVHKNLHA